MKTKDEVLDKLCERLVAESCGYDVEEQARIGEHVNALCWTLDIALVLWTTRDGYSWERFNAEHDWK